MCTREEKSAELDCLQRYFINTFPLKLIARACNTLEDGDRDARIVMIEVVLVLLVGFEFSFGDTSSMFHPAV